MTTRLFIMVPPLFSSTTAVFGPQGSTVSTSTRPSPAAGRRSVTMSEAAIRVPVSAVHRRGDEAPLKAADSCGKRQGSRRRAGFADHRFYRASPGAPGSAQRRSDRSRAPPSGPDRGWNWQMTGCSRCPGAKGMPAAGPPGPQPPVRRRIVEGRRGQGVEGAGVSQRRGQLWGLFAAPRR